jgi:hypothetical protein
MTPFLLLFLGCADSASQAGPDEPDTGGAGDTGDAAPSAPELPALYAALAELEGVTLLSSTTAYDGATVLELSLWQPVDHGDPEGPGFEQHLTLRHLDADKPMVLYGTGYQDYWGAYLTELQVLADANQISIEKRYFGDSVPEGDIDWTTSNVDQIAADWHAVIETFRGLYPGPWMTSGGSQGGMDAVHHRRRYPDDVVGTYALAAPFLTSLADDRCDAFFAEAVDQDCHARLLDIRRALMTPAADGGLLDDAVDQVSHWGLSYERVGGIDVAIRIYAVEFPWIFWQYGSPLDCADLPSPSEDPAGALSWGMAWYSGDASDEGIEPMEAYWYGVATENGYPRVPVDDVADLIDPEWPNYPDFYPPEAAPVEFESPVADLQEWIDEEADQVLFVFGELDPFLAYAIDVEEARGDVRLYVAPQANHNVSAWQLEAADQAAVEEVIAGWLQ